jgi:hypothetical protein
VVKLARAALRALPLVLLVLVVLSWRAPTAQAHPESLPTLVNHYISLIVVDDHAELVVTLLHGDLPGAERRRAMDTDHDGAIDEDELERERREWTRQADELVRASLDGRALPIVPSVAIDLAGDPRVAARPLVVEIAAHVPLGPGRHTFTIEPGPDRPHDGETEVSVDLGAQGELVSSRHGQGQPTQPPQSRFLFSGPRAAATEDRAVTFVVDANPRGGVRTEQSVGAVAAAAVVVILALASGAIVLHRRRRR